MLVTSARLLRLLSMLQAREYWSGAELAERLEVTGRTLRRDVDRLRSLGYPVHSTSGTAGGYKLGAGASLPPLLLDDDEAVAVAVGLQMAAGGSVAEIEGASSRALGKLEQVLPKRLRRRLGALRSSIVRLADAGPTVKMADVSALSSACAERRELRFSYRDFKGAPTTRVVEPHRLVYTAARWYLVAWDRDREDWRTFRIDRIDDPVATGAHFLPRPSPDDDVGAYVARGRAAAAYRHRAIVALHAPLADMRERIPSMYGQLEAIDERTCLLQASAFSLETLLAWIAGIGVDFDVREPPELVAHMERVANLLLRATTRAQGEGAVARPR
ncbi:MAG TPA: YafY family protein [Polyangiaceae bacterium]|jgi:predicted DNA-binding transcriptional regulator YafY|nr:YafY family protein [Polyangiaceae bacterium]